MGIKTFDFDIDDLDNVDIKKDEPNKKQGYDFDSNVVRDFPFLVKFHAVNKYYSVDNRNMEKLLNGLDIVTRGSNMYCPFHDDAITGKPSAKYHPDSDMVYCFSESKVYTSYHALKDLYGYDMNKIFRESWRNLSDFDKEEIVRKYGDEERIDKREFIDPIWKELNVVVSQFMCGNVSFKKHRTALYKIMSMIYESKNSKKSEDGSGIMLPDNVLEVI